MSEEMLIRHCAPTLAGLKTGNMYNDAFESEAHLRESVCALNRRFRRKGLHVVPLRYRNGRALLYVYRPGKLAKDLLHKTAADILTAGGYKPEKPGKCIACLREKLRENEDFPHEIGLFLGYPPEDVAAFICNKAENCKCVGCWKVYGDEIAAKKTFERFKKCAAVYAAQYAQGKSIERLIVAV